MHHCKKTRVVLTELAYLANPVPVPIGILKCYPMQLKSDLDQGHGTPAWDSYLVPLKAYNLHNVPAC